MSISAAKQYLFYTGIGATCGALFSVALKNFQVWQSPYGGYIACLFAERVAANPLHINMGLNLAVNATVPMDYTLIGSVVPAMCTFNTLLISTVALGILIGASYTLIKRQIAAT